MRRILGPTCAEIDKTGEEWCLLGCYAVWAVVRTDVSEEPGTSFIRVTTISELGTTQAATGNRRTLQLVLFLVHRFLSP
jgi:hypothetical protein